MRYCLDSSVLIQAWNRLYPPSAFPGVWGRMEALVESGEIVSSDEVRREIERKDDLLHVWCKPRAAMFLPRSADVQTAAAAILAALPRLVDARTGKSMADPFRRRHGPGHRDGLGYRGTTHGPNERPKIPEACERADVTWVSVLDLIKAEGWVFG